MEKRRVLKTESLLDAQTLYNHCRSADDAQQSAAYQQLGIFLLRILLSRVRSAPHQAVLAEECSQQALMVVWQKLSTNTGPNHPQHFLTWCASIAIHKLLDAQRKWGRRQHASWESYEEDGPSTGDPDALDPEENAVVEELNSRLLSAIQMHHRLNDDEKTVLLYGFLLEWGDDELARHLKKKQSSIRVLRYRALNKLRKDAAFMKNVTF